MDEWIDGWMDGWMDGQMDTITLFKHENAINIKYTLKI